MRLKDFIETYGKAEAVSITDSLADSCATTVNCDFIFDMISQLDIDGDCCQRIRGTVRSCQAAADDAIADELERMTGVRFETWALSVDLDECRCDHLVCGYGEFDSAAAMTCLGILLFGDE